MRRRALTTALLGIGSAALLSRSARAAPRAFGRGSWQALRSAHHGQRTIVHFWGLTCGPCLVELPHWGQFHHAHPQADLVMVAADAIPQQPDALIQTLAKTGLQGVENWWFQDRFTERLFWEVSPDWQGELPYTVFLAPDGSSVKQVGVVEGFTSIASWLDGGRLHQS